MNELTELERQYYASQREIAFIRQALGIGESDDIFKAIDDLAERSELERAAVEAMTVTELTTQIGSLAHLLTLMYERFPVEKDFGEAIEVALVAASAARAAQGRTA